MFQGTITKQGIIPVKGSVAEISMLPENICPFLNETKLCNIQRMYGESFLSVTCSVFPRVYNFLDGRLELSLDFSCPHATDLALSDPTPIRFTVQETEDYSRIYKIASLNLNDTTYPSRIYPYFEEVRKFIFTLMQNRNYSLENRMIILGRFCNDLHQQINPSKEQILQLKAGYMHSINLREFDFFINSIPKSPAAFLKTIVSLLEYRLKTGATSKQFIECMNQFKQGLCITDQISEEALSSNYTKTKSAYYDPYMKEKEHILENYIVNYIFKSVFPYGKQSSIFNTDTFIVKQTVLSGFALLVLHYTLIKNMLVGISGYYKEQFCQQHILNLIQLYDKNIGHDVPYQQKLLQFFDENKMLNFSGIIMLAMT